MVAQLKGTDYRNLYQKRRFLSICLDNGNRPKLAFRNKDVHLRFVLWRPLYECEP